DRGSALHGGIRLDVEVLEVVCEVVWACPDTSPDRSQPVFEAEARPGGPPRDLYVGRPHDDDAEGGNGKHEGRGATHRDTHRRCATGCRPSPVSGVLLWVDERLGG